MFICPTSGNSVVSENRERAAGKIAFASGIILMLGIVLAATQRYSGMPPIVAQVVIGISTPFFTMSLFIYLMAYYQRQGSTPRPAQSTSSGHRTGHSLRSYLHLPRSSNGGNNASRMAARRRRDLQQPQPQQPTVLFYNNIFPGLLGRPNNVNILDINNFEDNHTISPTDFQGKRVVIVTKKNGKKFIAVLHDNKILELTEGSNGKAIARILANGRGTAIQNPTRTHDQIKPFVDYIENFQSEEE